MRRTGWRRRLRDRRTLHQQRDTRHQCHPALPLPHLTPCFNSAIIGVTRQAERLHQWVLNSGQRLLRGYAPYVAMNCPLMPITFIAITRRLITTDFNGHANAARYWHAGNSSKITRDSNAPKTGEGSNACAWQLCCTTAMVARNALAVARVRLNFWLLTISMEEHRNKAAPVPNCSVGSKLTAILPASGCSAITATHLLVSMAIALISKRLWRAPHKPGRVVSHSVASKPPGSAVG